MSTMKQGKVVGVLVLASAVMTLVLLVSMACRFLIPHSEGYTY